MGVVALGAYRYPARLPNTDKRLVGRCPPRQRGQALVELAICLPLLLILFTVLVELGSAFYDYISVISSSREGARLAARSKLFDNSEIGAVVQQHSASLDWAGQGALVITRTKAFPSGSDFTLTTATATVFGSASSHFNSTSLRSLYGASTAGSQQAFLRDESFVVAEVFYTHRFITGFFGASLPLYAYTMMLVAGPS